MRQRLWGIMPPFLFFLLSEQILLEEGLCPTNTNLRTPIQRQASPAASPARRKGARGENQKIAVSRMACPRFIKFIRLLTKPTSDGSCGKMPSAFSFGRINKNCACPRELSNRK